MSNVFLHHSPPFYLEVGSLMKPRAHQFSQTGCPVSSRDPVISASPVLDYKCMGACQAFQLGTRAPKLGFMAST